MSKAINHIVKILLFFGVCTSSVSCGDEPAPAPVPPRQVSRTVLVYQAANNNLGTHRYNEMDIEEMIQGAKAGAIGDDGRLLVYNAGPTGVPFLLEIKSSGADTLKRYTTDLLSVESERMKEVFDDMQNLAPADDYGLILWSHGSGWLQDGMADEADTPRPLSFGSEKGKTMNITTLANVIADGPSFSFLYFDCCYMGSVETLYELRHCAPVIAASATELLVYGMPYHQNIEHFFKKGHADLVSAARNTYDYYNSLSGSNRTCTMVVIDTSALDALAASTEAIYAKANPSLPAGHSPQRFMNVRESSCYYFDFEHYVRALCFEEDNAERFDGAARLFDTFTEELERTVTYKASTPRLWNAVPLTYHCGLSTYILRTGTDNKFKHYNTLSWYADVASSLTF